MVISARVRICCANPFRTASFGIRKINFSDSLISLSGRTLFASRQDASKRTKITLKGYFSSLGDLGESRTRIDGMKTRCTDRYTTRPFWYNIIIPNILEIARVMVVDVVVLAAVGGFWVDGDVSIGFVTITGDGGAIATVAAVIEEKELVQIDFAKADFGIMSEGFLEGFAGVFAGFLEL